MSQHLELLTEPQVLDLLALGKLRRLVMMYFLLRQHKDIKPAQQALRQHQALHQDIVKVSHAIG